MEVGAECKQALIDLLLAMNAGGGEVKAKNTRAPSNTRFLQRVQFQISCLNSPLNMGHLHRFAIDYEGTIFGSPSEFTGQNIVRITGQIGAMNSLVGKVSTHVPCVSLGPRSFLIVPPKMIVLKVLTALVNLEGGGANELTIQNIMSGDGQVAYARGWRLSTRLAKRFAVSDLSALENLMIYGGEDSWSSDDLFSILGTLAFKAGISQWVAPLSTFRPKEGVLMSMNRCSVRGDLLDAFLSFYSAGVVVSWGDDVFETALAFGRDDLSTENSNEVLDADPSEFEHVIQGKGGNFFGSGAGAGSPGAG
jgi:hypothetical protein